MFGKLVEKLLVRKKNIAMAYKIVSIYADSSENLYIIPNSIRQMKGAEGGAIAEMDDVYYLAYSCTNELLEGTLFKVLEQCHTSEPKWPNGLSPMEQYLNIKGYAKAVKNKKLVILDWNIDYGYAVIPTKKIPRQGYVHEEQQKIILGKIITSGKLAIAVKQAFGRSTC